jgi:hypothetical protein
MGIICPDATEVDLTPQGCKPANFISSLSGERGVQAKRWLFEWMAFEDFSNPFPLLGTHAEYFRKLPCVREPDR